MMLTAIALLYWCLELFLHVAFACISGAKDTHSHTDLFPFQL